MQCVRFLPPETQAIATQTQDEGKRELQLSRGSICNCTPRHSRMQCVWSLPPETQAIATRPTRRGGRASLNSHETLSATAGRDTAGCSAAGSCRLRRRPSQPGQRDLGETGAQRTRGSICNCTPRHGWMHASGACRLRHRPPQPGQQDWGGRPGLNSRVALSTTGRRNTAGCSASGFCRLRHRPSKPGQQDRRGRPGLNSRVALSATARQNVDGRPSVSGPPVTGWTLHWLRRD